MLSPMKKAIGWFVFTRGAFCFFQGNLNLRKRSKIRSVSVREVMKGLDVKPQQTRNSVNIRRRYYLITGK